jgi:hypothetical protein
LLAVLTQLIPTLKNQYIICTYEYNKKRRRNQYIKASPKGTHLQSQLLGKLETGDCLNPGT